jgi:hypothetical protein
MKTPGFPFEALAGNPFLSGRAGGFPASDDNRYLSVLIRKKLFRMRPPIPISIYGQKPFKIGFLAGAPCQNPGVSIRKFEFPDGN